MANTTEEVRLILTGGSRFNREISNISRNTSKFDAAARRARGSTSRLGTQMGKTNGTAQLLSRTMIGLGGALAGLGIALGAISLIRLTADFGVLRSRLQTFSGSVEETEKNWQRLLVVARTTPFDIDRVIAGFTELRAVGLEPTDSQLQRIADVAAATGRQFEDLTAIIFKGQQSLELFQNIGVRAVINGEMIDVTYQGVTTSIARSAEGIQDYLVSLGMLEGIQGSAARLATELAGALSNLSSNFETLAVNIFGVSGAEGGLSETLTEIGDGLARISSTIDETGSVYTGFVRELDMLQATGKTVVLVLTTLTTALVILAAPFIGAAIAITGVVLALRELLKSFDTVEPAARDIASSLKTAEDRARELRIEIDKSGESQGTLQMALVDTTKELISQANALRDATDAQREFYGAQIASRIRIHDAAIGATGDAIERLDEQLSNTGVGRQRGEFQRERAALVEHLESLQVLRRTDALTLENIGVNSGDSRDVTLTDVNPTTVGGEAAATDAPTFPGGLNLAMLIEQDTLQGQYLENQIAFTDRLTEIGAVSNSAKYDAGIQEGLLSSGAVPDNLTPEYIENQRELQDLLLEQKLESLSYLQEIDLNASIEKMIIEQGLTDGLLTQEQARTATARVESNARMKIQQAELAGAAGFLSSLGGFLATSGQQSKAAFYASKAVALAEVAVNTQVAASKVGAQTGIFGLPLAAIIYAQGALQAATIVGTTIAGRQTGGRVNAGTPYRVGEAGTETFIPQVNGRIANNRETTGGGGTTMIDNREINMNISGNVDQRAIDQILEVVSAEPAMMYQLANAGRSYDRGF